MASPCVGGSPPQPAFYRFTLVQACGFASAPSAPRVTPTHWASAIELQRPKLEKDFNLLAGEAAWRTTRLRGAVAPLKAVVERIPQP